VLKIWNFDDVNAKEIGCHMTIGLVGACVEMPLQKIQSLKLKDLL
jgi:hypothetical protein